LRVRDGRGAAPGAARCRGRAVRLRAAGYKAMFGELRAAFPDLNVAVEHLVATDDELAFAYTISGTHLGPLMGHPPTGRKVSYRGMQISRFDSDGRLVERWGSSDELGMLRQLGLTGDE
ncbi:ester cyclase, partial [Streptomyces sp. NPDC004457]